MTTAYTTNLGLALPVTGELTGTWGDVVNNEITSLLDSAIAGTTVLNVDVDTALSDDDGVANQSRQAILLWTANGTSTRTITAPARTKTYIVINATTGSQSIKLVGAGPTAGVTIIAGEKCVVAWSSTDFVKVASSVFAYPGAGIAVSTGSAWNTSIPIPAGNLVGTTEIQTLTNKTIEAGTFTNGYTEEFVTGSTGTAYTINLNNGTIQYLTLTSNCSFTFPTPTAGKSFMVLLKQDGTGNRTVTWPASVKWPASASPVLTAAANKADKLVFTADGTYWWGSVAGQNYL